MPRMTTIVNSRSIYCTERDASDELPNVTPSCLTFECLMLNLEAIPTGDWKLINHFRILSTACGTSSRTLLPSC